METILELVAAVSWKVVFCCVYEPLLYIWSVLRIDIKNYWRNDAYNRNTSLAIFSMTS